METAVTHGGLFSGVGGFSKGFENAGIKSLWEVEIDPKCQQVLRKQFPSAKIHGDIKTFNADEFECPDIISFGFPCTDVSIAGKRGGVIDGETRSGLFYEACRIIKRFVPRGLHFAVAENVPGLFSASEGRAFAAILGTLGELGALDIGWATLDSQWFGLAQRRERVFIVVDFRGQRASQILSLSEGLCWHPAPRRTQGKGTSADIAPSLTASGTGVKSTGEIRGQDPVIAEIIPEIANTLRKEHDGGIRPDFDTCVVSPTLDANHNRKFGSNQWVNNGFAMCVAFQQNQSGDVYQSDIPGALSTNQNATGRGTAKILSQYKVRRLTPNECAILSGFPPSWNDWLKDSPRYAQFGNCCNVPVCEWIGRRIVSAFNL